MTEQLRFIQREDGMLFFCFIETNDCLGYLVHKACTAVRRFKIEPARYRAQQVQGRA